MIQKISQDYTFNIETFEVSCDGCDEVKDYEVECGWDELMQKIKEDGWISRKVNGEWQHFCSLYQSN